MSTIQTHTGRLIDLKNMVSSDVDIQDIVHGLSAIRRFNGRGITVLQHTLSMFDYTRTRYRGAERDKVLSAVLIHDLSEAYIGDIIQPVKAAVPDIALLETSVQYAILNKLYRCDDDRFVVPPYVLPGSNLLAVVKHIDLIALAAEYKLLFGDYTKTDDVWGINKLSQQEVLQMGDTIKVTDESKDGGKANRERFELLLLRLYAGLPLEG